MNQTLDIKKEDKKPNSNKEVRKSVESVFCYTNKDKKESGDFVFSGASLLKFLNENPEQKMSSNIEVGKTKLQEAIPVVAQTKAEVNNIHHGLPVNNNSIRVVGRKAGMPDWMLKLSLKVKRLFLLVAENGDYRYAWRLFCLSNAFVAQKAEMERRKSEGIKKAA